jgi:hypothetical protein
MSADKKLAAVALSIGLAVGCAAGYVAKTMAGCEPRFILRPLGPGTAFKIDTRTGETWFLAGDTETPVQRQK